MNTVIEIEVPGQFPVKLEQAGAGWFRVTYGAQVTSLLTQADARREFAACLFHALGCAGKLDGEL